MSQENRRGILWALAAAAGIAGFIIPWKMASSYGANSATNALVLLCAAAVFNSLLLIVRQLAVPRFNRLDLAVAAGLGAFTLLGNLASALSIQLISPALMTVVQRGEVVVIALLAWPILGERIDRKFWLGVAIAAGGLLLLHDPATSGESTAVGIAWAGAATLCFGAMAVITRKFIHQIDPVSVNALRLWLSVAFWFGWNGVPPELFEITAPQAGYATLAAFFGPFLGRLSMMMSAKYVEARITTLTTLAAPPLALVLGYVVLSDLPTAREIQGGVIMMVGISIPILSLARSRPETVADPAAPSRSGKR